MPKGLKAAILACWKLSPDATARLMEIQPITAKRVPRVRRMSRKLLADWRRFMVVRAFLLSEQNSTTSKCGSGLSADGHFPACSGAILWYRERLCEHSQRNLKTTHVRHHLASGRGQDHVDGEAVALRRRRTAGGISHRPQKPARNNIRLDGAGKKAWDFDQLHRVAI